MTEPNENEKDVVLALHIADMSKSYWDNPDRVKIPNCDSHSGHEMGLWILAKEVRRLRAEKETVAEDAYWKGAKEAINKDKTGLAYALDEVKKTADGYFWVTEGSGPYEWNDDEYRKEMGRMIESIRALCNKGLRESGKRVHQLFRAAEKAKEK